MAYFSPMWNDFLCLVRLLFWVFLTHMYWLLMSDDTTFMCSLEITFPIWVFLSYMYWLLMCGNTVSPFSMVITFPTWVFLTKVYWLMMFSEKALICKLGITFPTEVFFPHLYWLLMPDETVVSFRVAYNHIPHMGISCSSILTFDVYWDCHYL